MPFEIRMDGPHKNALGEELLGWLEEQMVAAEDRPILLTGTGDAFCAGLDLAHLAGLDAAGAEGYLRRVDALARGLFLHPAPTVALVNGHAIAGGCVLSMCCDHRVAVDEERLRLGLNEVALGACYPPATFNLLRYRLSAEHVERVLLGADLFSPRAALALGLLDEVSEDAATLARERLARLAAHPARTYALTKAALRTGVVRVDPDQERRFVEEELPIWTSPAMKARVLAVLGR